MNSEQVTHKDTFLLGRTRGYNPRVLEYVSAEVMFGKRIGTFPTVEHESITDPAVLTISFTVGPRRAGYPDWDEAITRSGQVLLADRKIVRPPLHDKYRWGELPGYDLRHAIEVLWREWHLNDTVAGCAHQVVPAGIRDADPIGYLGDHIKRCPITGYRWGSQWLIKPLNDSALERIASLDLTEVERENGEADVASRTS